MTSNEETALSAEVEVIVGDFLNRDIGWNDMTRRLVALAARSQVSQPATEVPVVPRYVKAIGGTGWRQEGWDIDPSWPGPAARSQPATEGLREAASILLTTARTVMPEKVPCGHDRRWLLGLLDDLRAALAATEPAGDER